MRVPLRQSRPQSILERKHAGHAGRDIFADCGQPLLPARFPSSSTGAPAHIPLRTVRAAYWRSDRSIAGPRPTTLRVVAPACYLSADARTHPALRERRAGYRRVAWPCRCTERPDRKEENYLRLASSKAGGCRNSGERCTHPIGISGDKGGAVFEVSAASAVSKRFPGVQYCAPGIRRSGSAATPTPTRCAPTA